jgi:rhodanese-related sulfurtransferase
MGSAFDWILPIVLGLLLGILLSTRKKHDYTQIQTLPADQFSQNMRKGQLIDARSEEQFKAGHILGSRHYPKRSVFDHLSKLRRDQPIYLIVDAKAVFSSALARKLIRKGFRPVYLLEGGLEKWPYPLREGAN